MAVWIRRPPSARRLNRRRRSIPSFVSSVITPTTGTAAGVGRITGRTNYIWNASQYGATTTYPPRGWDGLTNGTVAGITGAIVATGIENGIPYFDWHVSGTSTGATFSVNILPANYIRAAAGQKWAIGWHLKLVAGNRNNIDNIYVAVNGYDSSITYVSTPAYNSDIATYVPEIGRAHV